MENINRETLRIIKEAIQLEINGREFFEWVADYTTNSLGKKMFNKLAQDETEHLTVFGDLFSQALGNDDWKRFIREEEKRNSSIIKTLKTRIRGSEGSSELEALRIGMELERKAIEFFEKSAAETSDQKAGEICRRIADEEKWHYDLLQSQHDSVTNSGFWIDMAEFKMDGKY